MKLYTTRISLTDAHFLSGATLIILFHLPESLLVIQAGRGDMTTAETSGGLLERELLYSLALKVILRKALSRGLKSLA